MLKFLLELFFERRNFIMRSLVAVLMLFVVLSAYGCCSIGNIREDGPIGMLVAGRPHDDPMHPHSCRSFLPFSLEKNK